MDIKYVVYHLEQRIKGLKNWNAYLRNQIKENNKQIAATKRTIEQVTLKTKVNDSRDANTVHMQD